MMRAHAAALAVAALLLAAAGDAPGGGPQRRGRAARQRRPVSSQQSRGKGPAVAPGTWGGGGARLDVSGEGATVQYDCGRGAIREPLKLDAAGRFDLRGVFIRERGGPIRLDAKDEETPARYEGRVEGDTMTLTVTLGDAEDALGPFTLRRGQAGRLVKCL